MIREVLGDDASGLASEFQSTPMRRLGSIISHIPSVADTEGIDQNSVKGLHKI